MLEQPTQRYSLELYILSEGGSDLFPHCYLFPKTPDSIEETHGIVLQMKEWLEKRKLRLFLRQEFDFAESQMLRMRLFFMFVESAPSPESRFQGFEYASADP